MGRFEVMGTGHGPIILITARKNFGSLKITPLRALARWRPVVGLIVQSGGRYVARHNYVQNTSFGGHGTEGGPATRSAMRSSL